MTSQQALAASKAHMIAVMALGMIRQDDELMERLRKYAAADDAPFDADKLSALVVEMAEMALTIIGAKLLEHDGPVDDFRVVVPHTAENGGYERSAGALAVGSFTTEFVHSNPEWLEAFATWMRGEHADAVEDREISKDAIEDADHVLTLMAHVSGHLAAHEDEVPPDDTVVEVESEGTVRVHRTEHDDGIRYV